MLTTCGRCGRYGRLYHWIPGPAGGPLSVPPDGYRFCDACYQREPWWVRVPWAVVILLALVGVGYWAWR